MEGNKIIGSTLAPNLAEKMQLIMFSWYDYTFFAIMLGLSAAIGIYFGCFGSKQSTAQEYLMGGKTMKIIPITISLIASHISGISLLAVPADVYKFGAGYAMFIFPMVFVALTTMYIFLPVFFKLQITSTYEYLERRFDNRCRQFASFLFTLSVFMYLPVVIYIPALAFSASTGINVHYITPIVCGICIFYTTIGGLKAVVWTDTLQFTATLGSLFVVFILGVKSAGGVSAIFETSLKGHRLDVFDFDPDPTKRDAFWQVTIGVGFTLLSALCVNQSFVQKFLSVPTLADGKKTVVFSCLGLTFVSLVTVALGLIMYTKYFSCDPIATGAVVSNDQLLPYFVIDVAGHIPGLPGLFMAGITCSALSTLSASLNCLAGTVYEDFVAKYMVKASEKHASNVLKLIVLIIGVVSTVLVFVIEKFGGILPLVFSLNGITNGPLFALFTIGILFPKATSKGALYGSIISLIFMTWIVFTSQYYKMQGMIVYEPKPSSIEGCPSFNLTTESPVNNFSYEEYNTTFLSENLYTSPPNDTERAPFVLFRISYYYYSLMGFLVSMIAGLIISCFTQKDEPPVHRDLLSPVIYFLLPDEQDEKQSLQYYPVDKALKIVSTNNDND